MTAPGNRLPLADRLLVSAALLMVTLLAWAALVRPRPAMGEMEMAPGPLSFVAMWAVMMTAMMLPTELPAILLFTAVSSSRSRPGYLPVSSALFAAGYLGLWTLSGAGVLLLEQLAAPLLSAWHGQLAGATLLAAGLFQLTGLKSHCLRHCRTPLHFFMERWRDGPLGALYMGCQRGLYCLGCCWALMLLLIALGMMDVVWMAVVAGFIFLEKHIPHGEKLARVSGVALLLVGFTVLSPAGLRPLFSS